MIVSNYWIVKHDAASIEEHPGWIWREVRSENSNHPPNYLKVEKGDYFALISYPYRKEDENIHQVYGIYRVSRPVRFVRSQSAFVIEGKLLRGLKEKWVTVPNITKYYKHKFYGMAVLPAKSEEAFLEIQEMFENYSRKDVDYKPFEREPKNEQEVVALFTMNLERFRYKRFEKLQTKFPDARLVKHDGRVDLVEFEYYASGYDHPATYKGKNVKCVCWVDDREDSERRIDRPHVVEMRDRLAYS